MNKEIERAILKTLAYSDIFDYPLSKDEVWTFLITKTPLKRKEFEKELNYLSGAKPGTRRYSAKLVRLEGGHLYCLSGREVIIDTRLVRQKESQRKIVVAKKIVQQLSCIPTIQFIGISGALSLENSEIDDDIDLFVIASRGNLWLTRLAMIILLLLTGRYRRRNQRQVSDKICLNMLIDDGVLSFPKKRQNLYTAHEIVQLMPIFEQNNTYSKFITANKWVEKFLPNSIDTKILGYKDIKRKGRKSLSILISQYLNIFLWPFEWIAKTVQLWSIKRHITTETVKNGFLAFHPLDYKKKVLSEYKRRLKQYEI